MNGFAQNCISCDFLPFELAKYDRIQTWTKKNPIWTDTLNKALNYTLLLLIWLMLNNFFDKSLDTPTVHQVGKGHCCLCHQNSPALH